MKRTLYVSMVLVLFSIFTVWTQAFAAKSLLDDFSGANIDSQKWEYGELVREVVGGELVSKIGNDTFTEQARNSTAFQNPSSINIIQCDITVVATTKLDTGTDPRSFARIDGRFYNAKALNPTTHNGDIYSELLIGDRGSGLEAWWEIWESMDDEGNSWVDRGHGTLTVPGLTYGNNYTAILEYDGANQFTFTVAGVSSSPVFGPARQGAEFGAYKGLTTGAYSDGGSGTGYASALFDDVFTDKLAYDNFSAGKLVLAKWKNLEYVKEIDVVDEKLRLNVQAEGSRRDASMFPNDQTTAYLEAKVLVESGSQVSLGAEGLARIAGYYYNESRGPGSGQAYNGNEGDVWVNNRIALDDSHNLKAICSVWREPGTSLFYQEFPTPIAFDTEYTLSIEFTGSSLIFKCSDGNVEEYQYDIATPTYPPSNGPSRQLRSRVDADALESGYIKANFDDVYTGYIAQPTHDATGTWDVTDTDVWNSCDPTVQPEPSTITITQNGSDVTLVTEDGDTFTGTVSGTYYNLYGEFIEPGETMKMYIAFTLSSNTSGSGIYDGTWTDGVDWCEMGGFFTFTKQAATATTGSATSVTSSSATLNGAVNPNGLSTTYYFDYGTTTSYGSSTASANAGSGTSDVLVSTDVTGLSANTTYHVRIVATNSAGTSYGSDQSFTTLTVGGGGDGGGGIGCFIATAAYGSYMEPHVVILRDFRDRFLLTNLVGKVFVSLYYAYSPPVADFIANNDTVRLMVRWSLLPFVGMSWMTLQLGIWITLVLIGFLICFMGAGSTIALRRIRLRSQV